MAIGGPLVENPCPPIEIDNFRSDNLVCGIVECRKKLEEIHMQFSKNFCYNVFQKAITQSKVPNSTIFENMDVSNDAAS